MTVCGDKAGGGNLPQIESEDECECAQRKVRMIAKKKCKGKKR